MSAVENPVPTQVKKRAAHARALLDAAKKAASPEQPAAPAAPEAPPAAAPAAPEAPPATPEAPPAPPAEDFEAKYNTLRGKYEKEVPALQETLRATQLEIAEMKGRLAATPAAPTAPTSPARPATRVSAEEIDEYGPGLTDFVRRLTLDTVLPEVENLLAPLKDTAKDAAADTVELRRERLFTYLDQNVPNWRGLNTDKAFLDWLQQPDEFSGMKRGDILSSAYSRFDAARVATVFRSYSGAEPASTPAAPSAPPAADFASPAASRRPAAPPSAAPAKKQYKESEVKAFFRKSREGFYKGREKEADAIRKDIIAAGAEGRILIGQ